MSVDAFLPCLVCGKTLRNVSDDADNQPYSGTEFRTYGHYGSTFWDSFDGEQLVLNVCDECLKKHRDRLGQHKRYRPVMVDRVGMVGKHWIDRPMVAYTGHRDDGNVIIEPEEIGVTLGIEWCDNADEMRRFAIGINDDRD